MSSLQIFLPASEPARSEALAKLKRTHHVPRHIVKAPARGEQGRRAAVTAGAPQAEQSIPDPDLTAPDQQSG
ncbi:hypothetical protein VAR608DRAFT_3733 [Variovorax sp. HW608]|uniref:hypothetical protein n=1 Tax=Variovorax sp. HW608 TaxID=1034889 RepID=UPI00081FD0F0|nr:hypothetical protein [Variovorax sp. HW608]SCK39744.1 hypothetical protein VAR608DRAFT_3733 [Variovorax sp. HW608]